MNLTKIYRISRNLEHNQNKIVTNWINSKFNEVFDNSRYSNGYYLISNDFLDCWLSGNTHSVRNNFFLDNVEEINFEEFKKIFLNKDKEIVGYKLNGVVSKEIVNKVLNWNNSRDQDGLYFIKGHLGGCLVAEAKRLDILDKWFTPVYEDKPKFELPKINGCKGIYCKGLNTIDYGCASLSVDWFKPSINRSIDIMTLSSGVIINSDEIKQIREYLKHYE